MTALEYVPRLADEALVSALQRAGAVLIEGPRACGKTETALQVASSTVRLDRDPSTLDLLGIDPGLVLEGPTPRLFDEWQLAPELWNIVRGEVDARREKGQFILTGSTAPVVDAVRHTGAGRFARVHMRTMTLSETGHSTNETSFSALIAGDAPRAADTGLKYRRIVIGGWPGFQDLTATEVSQSLRVYLNTVAEIDLYATDGVRRDPIRVRRLFSALARWTATEVFLSTLAKDETSLSRDAVRDYLTALERVFVIEDQPAWSTHLRSSATLRREPKRHFVDPSLAVAALGAGVDALVQEPRFTGQLFESLVVQHLRFFSQPLGGTVTHTRDSYGRDLDGVVTLPDGTWAGFEVKLGHDKDTVDAAAAGLLQFADQVAGQGPSSLSVIVSSGPSYRRRDGVNVVAIGTLAP